MIKLTQLINELELTDDMRIHMAKKPFELEPRTFTQKDELKPTGFWYGFGSEWIDFYTIILTSNLFPVNCSNINSSN